MPSHGCSGKIPGVRKVEKTMSKAIWPTLEIVNAAPLRMVKIWWDTLPKRPVTDEQEAILERVAVICEAHGLVDADGKIKETA